MKPITIDLSVVGTPDQPVIPAGQTATIDMSQAPVPDPMNPGQTNPTNLGTLTLTSSAGQKRDDYFAQVNEANGGILPNSSTDPGVVFAASTLTDAWEQEFDSNPASGHNDPKVNEG